MSELIDENAVKFAEVGSKGQEEKPEEEQEQRTARGVRVPRYYGADHSCIFTKEYSSIVDSLISEELYSIFRRLRYRRRTVQQEPNSFGTKRNFGITIDSGLYDNMREIAQEIRYSINRTFAMAIEFFCENFDALRNVYKNAIETDSMGIKKEQVEHFEELKAFFGDIAYRKEHNVVLQLENSFSAHCGRSKSTKIGLKLEGSLYECLVDVADEMRCSINKTIALIAVWFGARFQAIWGKIEAKAEFGDFKKERISLC